MTLEVTGIERDFNSAPTLDTERKGIFNSGTGWSPSQITIFGHNILIDIPTGNLSVSTDDVSYNYYKLSLGINRKYDVQEQFMQLTYLQNYPNVDPKPHWFGNWQFGYEANVDAVWNSSCYEIQINSSLVNGIFDTKFPDFKRNMMDQNSAADTLRSYGVPGIIMSQIGWNFSQHDFLLRTIRGNFQMLSGRFYAETLADDIEADLFVFDPVNGSNFRISSQYFYNISDTNYRDIGYPLLITKLTDAMGHTIDLKPTSTAPPFTGYTLSDGSGRTFQLTLNGELTFLDGLKPGGLARKLLVSKITDKTKMTYNQFLYNYDSNNLLTKVRFPSSLGQRYFQYNYDDPSYVGILTSIENSFGQQIKFEYIEDPLDNDDRLNPRLKIKRITDPEGVIFDYSYDFTNSKVTVTISQKGVVDRIIQYNYIRDIQNTNRRYIVSTQTNVMRGYEIDATGNLVPRPKNSPQTILYQTQYSTDGRFNIVQTKDPIGRTVQYTKYNDFNLVEEKRNFDNHWTRYVYDIQPNPTPTNPNCYDLILTSWENLVRTTLTQFGTNFIESVQPISKSYKYARYCPINSTDPKDQGVQSTHRIISAVDERKKSWSFDYDDTASNNSLSPTKSTSPLGNITRVTYNNIGKIIKYTDPEGNLSVYQYNTQGQVTQLTDPNNNIVTFGYYPDGNWLQTYTDQLSKTTIFIRDVEGKIVTIKDPNNDSIDYQYYTNNRLNIIERHRPSLQQDPSNPTSKTLPYPNLQIIFDYTPLGMCNYLKNANGLELVYEFDDVGRLSDWYLNGSTLGKSKYTEFCYDAAGQLIQKVDRMGNSTIYSYYNSGFINKITFPPWNNGTTNMPGKIINFKKYDYLGRPFTVADSEILGSKEFVYDFAGNVILRIDPDSFQLSFTYDDDNRLTDVLDAKKFYELSLVLDSLGRYSTLTDSSSLDGSLDWNYTYTKTVGATKKVLSIFKREIPMISLNSSFDYDSRYQIQSLLHEWSGASSTSIYQQGYDYRDDGLLSSINLDDPLILRYDGLKQAIYEKMSGLSLSADYDQVGNRLYLQDKTINPNPPNDSYDDFNKIIQNFDTAEKFKHDDNGNLKTITSAVGSTDFYFDNTGFLRVVKSSNYKINYLYDKDGKLIERQKTDNTGVETIHIHYLLSKPIVIEKNGNPFMLLTWDGSGKLLRVRLSDVVGNGTYDHSVFPLHDRFGNLVRLVDDKQKTLAKITYDSWGNIQNITGKNFSQFWGYRGLFSDPDTQLIQSGLRWYRPLIGRWISEDMLPTVLLKGDTSKFDDLSNLYAYVGNNPINKMDISGFAPDDGATDKTSISTGDLSSSLTLTAGFEANLTIPVGPSISQTYVGGAGFYNSPKDWGIYSEKASGIGTGVSGGFNLEFGVYRSPSDFLGKGLEFGISYGDLLNVGLNLSFDPENSFKIVGFAVDIGVGAGLSSYILKSMTDPIYP